MVGERVDLVFVFDFANAGLALVVAFMLNLFFAGWPALMAARLH